MDPENNYTPPVKLPKTIDEDNQHDIYCFECHHEGDVINCDSCQRVYHPKCLPSNILPERLWTCPECEINQSSFNIINQLIPFQRYSINQLQIMLKYALRRFKSHCQAESFLHPIDSEQESDYFDYIIHPMDLETIGQNINLKKYSSTESFFSDMKWILHNNQSKVTNNARTLIKIARHEMTEIEICPECYLSSIQSTSTDWFIKPCTIPHTLCWAKMKTYQSWPAKVLRVINDEVDVRFFGEHDRARVSLNQCFVLSKEYPGSEKKKSNNFDKSLAELQRHIDQLKKLYGHFTYAPLYTLISTTKPFKFVSIIDDSILPSYITAANCSQIYYSSSKHSKQQQRRTSSELNLQKTIKRTHENSTDNQESIKRVRVSSNDNDEFQSTLNVFDIFNQSDQSRNSNRSSRIRPSSPTDNKLIIQALIRKYIRCEPPPPPSISPDVRSSMDALLDAVEALKTISEVHTNLNTSILPEQNIRTKKPRKSNSQHRIIQNDNNVNLFTCSSLDQSFHTIIPMIPLRPLSVSPPIVNTFERLPSVDHQQFEILDMKSESIDNEQSQSSISLTLPPPAPPLEENLWPSILSIHPTQEQRKTRTRRRSVSLQSRSNGTTHSISKQILPHVNQIPLDDHETRNNIQMIINNFNDQFQQLVVDFTGEIESSLRTTRIKYEKDLEETRRSYLLSLNELHSITTEQVQEMHNSLELQYWKRLSEMRNRYESKLQELH